MDLEKLNAIRRNGGFLSIEDTINLSETENHVYDPFSTLIATHLEIGAGNVFFPGTILHRSGESSITIGNRNIFYAGCLLEATQGKIWIGDENQFGEGGFTAKANRPGADIRFGNQGRYLNNPLIFGETYLGNGSQVLGNIQVDSCQLDSGDSFRGPDPDKRGGLLKGSGIAKNLHVLGGHVIAAQGDFSESEMLPQSHFHPKR